MKYFHSGKVALHAGDCLEVMRSLPGNSVDACVTDPPYGLSFMGRSWDHATGIAFTPGLWAEVLRVLKPGGHCVAFGGTRTYHRMVCATEDAGFEIRDQLAWCYGSGFPKSHNIGNGFGTALKPAWEPICLARKPLSESTVAANVLRWGTGALNIDGCRIGTTVETWPASRSYAPGQMQPGGKGQTVSTGDAPNGRWPANLCHDGSPEVLAGFPDAGGGFGKRGGEHNSEYGFGGTMETVGFGDSGSAARFFYTSKAGADDRLGSKHPTVKPVDLMQWLVRLVCPKGATVLDPFAGTGTTGAAAFIEGCKAVLIEREAEYRADIERRMDMLVSGPNERAQKLVKQEPSESLPLFGAAS